jgi:hypothetical protein
MRLDGNARTPPQVRVLLVSHDFCSIHGRNLPLSMKIIRHDIDPINMLSYLTDIEIPEIYLLVR